MAHTDGSVKKATAGKCVLGIALGDGASGKPVEMMIMHDRLPAE